MSFKSEPLSIESLLQKQRVEKESASKVSAKLPFAHRPSSSRIPQPKFLSKEERAKIAIERRAKEIEDQKKKDEALKAARENLDKEAADIAIRTKDRERDHSSRYSRNSQCQFFAISPLGGESLLRASLIYRRRSLPGLWKARPAGSTSGRQTRPSCFQERHSYWSSCRTWQGSPDRSNSSFLIPCVAFLLHAPSAVCKSHRLDIDTAYHGCLI